LTRAQLQRDVTPLRYGVRILQQVLVGEVGDVERRLAGQPMIGGSIVTRGSSKSGRMLKPCWSIGSRTTLTSTRPLSPDRART
jgi:hypothetical protein